MSKYVKGLKRQQIIQRWLQGVDDKEYEVFPTKVENKYIVKKRVEPLSESNEPVDEQVDEPVTEQVDEQVDDTVTEEVKPTQSKKTVTKPKPLPTVPKRIRDSNPADLTVSYEILNQLKELGNELKQQRIKKEQKSMIKQVVQKQMTKRPRKQILKEESDEYEYYDEPDGSSTGSLDPSAQRASLSAYANPSPSTRAQHKRTNSIIEQPQPSSPQQIFKSRIRR